MELGLVYTSEIIENGLARLNRGLKNDTKETVKDVK